MTPSFPSEGKTVLVWVKILPFLCLLQIFHSPWELSVDHTLLKNNGSFWSGTLDKHRNHTANKDGQNKPCHGCPMLWGSRVGTGGCLAQPGDTSAASKAASACCPPENKPPSGLSAPPISATRHLHMSPCHELLLPGLFLTHSYSQRQVFIPQNGIPWLSFLMVQRKSLNPWE